MMVRWRIVVTTAAAAAVTLSTINRASPIYLWNASYSVPLGLYRLTTAGELRVTDLVAVRPPESLARFLALNGYLPAGVPMLKRVLGLPGQTVCRTATKIFLDDLEMGEARPFDGRGRPLPDWQGCRVIAVDEIFLMNWQSADSLDGRYFGPVARSTVLGRALPVWTESE
jgi:conjugative transfer signal peptidase TraF